MIKQRERHERNRDEKADTVDGRTNRCIYYRVREIRDRGTAETKSKEKQKDVRDRETGMTETRAKQRHEKEGLQRQRGMRHR
jgi:hypothetical protein